MPGAHCSRCGDARSLCARPALTRARWRRSSAGRWLRPGPSSASIWLRRRRRSTRCTRSASGYWPCWRYSSRWWRCCSRVSAYMACWIIPCCNGGARLAFAWRSGRKQYRTLTERIAKKFKLPSFDEGGVVGETGLAMVHKGETILPTANDTLKRAIELSTAATLHAEELARARTERLVQI